MIPSKERLRCYNRYVYRLIEINKEYAPKLFSKEENFTAFRKRERNMLSEDIALLFSGSTKDIRRIGVAKEFLRNEL